MAVIVLFLFLAVPWVGLQCVIVPSQGRTHFFILIDYRKHIDTLSIELSILHLKESGQNFYRNDGFYP